MKLLLLFGIVALTNAATPRAIPATRLLYHHNASTKNNASARQYQSLTCFDGLDKGGRRVELGIEFLADLGQSPYWFDDRIVSCCFNGIYLLYGDYNYNSASLNGAVYAEAWGENYCVNFASSFQRAASSLRLTGAPDGYKYATFNIYEGVHYQGRELYYYDDASRLYYVNFGRSVIVTGCSPWTVYDDVNFQGQSACFYPSDTANCYPGFFRDERSMQGWSGRIASVRLGCSTKTTAYYGGEGIGNASAFQNGKFLSPAKQ